MSDNFTALFQAPNTLSWTKGACIVRARWSYQPQRTGADRLSEMPQCFRWVRALLRRPHYSQELASLEPGQAAGSAHVSQHSQRPPGSRVIWCVPGQQLAKPLRPRRRQPNESVKRLAFHRLTTVSQCRLPPALALGSWPTLLRYVSLQRRAMRTLLSGFESLGFGSFLRQRINRAARCLKVRLVRQTIRETLAFDTLNSKRRTFPVVNAEGRAVVKTEIKFREIAMQVLFLAMLVSAAHAALEH